MDVSSDRDFVLESAFALALIAEHLSTWAEEWILWSTVEFSFLKLPQEFCTGSSIMPQKINPDVLELTRGKTARVIGNLQTLLVLVKGLPLAYNRDLQEDKPALFDSFDTVEACLELAAPLVQGAELNRRGHCRAAGSRLPGRDDVDGVPDPPRHAATDGASPGRRAGRQGHPSAACRWRICRWRSSSKSQPGPGSRVFTRCWAWRTRCGPSSVTVRPRRRRSPGRWQVGNSKGCGIE